MSRPVCTFASTLFFFSFAVSATAQQERPSLQQVRAEGARQSNYLRQTFEPKRAEAPQADVDGFQRHIRPLLKEACFECHGPQLQEGNIRIDTLDPDLIHGQDATWWLEILSVLSNGEMPPPDDAELTAAARSQIVGWLSSELQLASAVARARKGQSSFRRMTRYEYNYALQDLLSLPYNFAADLPPESSSEDGFLNSSEMLQMSVMQFETYRRIARSALNKATVRGARPEPVYYAITMDVGLEKAREKYEADLEKLRQRFADDPVKLEREIAKRQSNSPKGAHYRDLKTGAAATARWSYGGARFARKPVPSLPVAPDLLPNVAVIPRGQKLIVDLGDHLPDSGMLRVRLRAGRTPANEAHAPSLRIYFGHQASNNSRADERVSDTDLVIAALADSPEFYVVDIPLSEVVRNPFRGIQKLGMTPNPAEYLMLQNASESPAAIQIDYIEITAPFYETWPPESHRRIFGNPDDNTNEAAHVRDVLTKFMTRAWRRPPTDSELDRKAALFAQHRARCDDAQEALLEVLADVLCAPDFIYLISSEEPNDDFELATRLAIFLWSSLPDDQLLESASTGRLSDIDVLRQQTDRMLADPRGRRLSEQFVRQWLGMELLDHVRVDHDLRSAMHEEPIALFEEILRNNDSVMDFLHSDYTVVNGKLARHYGITDVYGSEFRRVSLPGGSQRGGLLTQAGLLAMNSDGEDSHPLKRGIWLLESILNDPPPPPPPAVPEIDLTDPDILKLTLKERMEDHRNDPACMSCHQRIDPWGIAFENFDALGKWRTTVKGKPVDSESLLFNNQKLSGMDGLKRFLLANRQDQFARAITHKLMAYALGRPLGFADRGEVDRVTASLRQQGNGLRTLVHLIVTSELFTAVNILPMPN